MRYDIETKPKCISITFLASPLIFEFHTYKGLLSTAPALQLKLTPITPPMMKAKYRNPTNEDAKRIIHIIRIIKKCCYLNFELQQFWNFSTYHYNSYSYRLGSMNEILDNFSSYFLGDFIFRLGSHFVRNIFNLRQERR